MTDLQKEFESTGQASWVNSDIYPDGKIHTREYTEWLERMVLDLRKLTAITQSANGIFCDYCKNDNMAVCCQTRLDEMINKTAITQ